MIQCTMSTKHTSELSEWPAHVRYYALRSYATRYFRRGEKIEKKSWNEDEEARRTTEKKYGKKRQWPSRCSNRHRRFCYKTSTKPITNIGNWRFIDGFVRQMRLIFLSKIDKEFVKCIIIEIAATLQVGHTIVGKVK